MTNFPIRLQVPANPEAILDLPAIQPINSRSSDEEIDSADADRCELTLQMIHHRLRDFREMSVNSFCRLASTSLQIMAERRKYLGKQYGSKAESKAQGFADLFDGSDHR